ncbi:MAG: hypothetical protein LBC68_10200 [Prevotellaceae bacterium]|jgi:hypothetical protein|nr:hypothetical protein [Prevotellaceae bacterium]
MFQVKVGIDSNRNNALDSSEVRDTVDVVVMAIDKVTITGKNQDGSWHSAITPTATEVCFSNDVGADVQAKLSAICKPDTPEVRQLSLWKISGDHILNTSNGNFSLAI